MELDMSNISSVITNGMVLNSLNSTNTGNTATGTDNSFANLLSNVMGNGQLNGNTNLNNILTNGNTSLLGSLYGLNNGQTGENIDLLSLLLGLNQNQGTDYTALIEALKEIANQDEDEKNSSIEQLMEMLKSGNLSIANDPIVLELINSLKGSTDNSGLSNVIKNSIMYTPVVDPKKDLVSDTNVSTPKTGFDAMNLPPDVMERINSALAARDSIRAKMDALSQMAGSQQTTTESVNVVATEGLDYSKVNGIGEVVVANTAEDTKVDDLIIDSKVVDGSALDLTGSEVVIGRDNIKISDEASLLRSSVMEQIKDQITTMKADGKQTVTMQLNPESLGKLDIKMVFENGNLSVEIFTTTAKAQSLIMSNMDELKSILQNSLINNENRFNVGDVEGKNSQGQQQAFYNQQQNQEQREQQNEANYYDNSEADDTIGDIDFYTQLSMMRR